ncbi:hypothetical protein ACFRQM_46600 [Streptomyces sp. NPDC056831]|uniref:hypothetical protein n=1 Tax=Streptomyces sp. NPDC056831 TaxID=3345954 RepID=UPI0036A469AD
MSGEIRALLAGAVAEDASAVLCACSTIGGVAESAAVTLGVPVLRVDHLMAAAAAERERVVVLATDSAPLGLALLAEGTGGPARRGSYRDGRRRLGVLRSR